MELVKVNEEYLVRHMAGGAGFATWMKSHTKDDSLWITSVIFAVAIFPMTLEVNITVRGKAFGRGYLTQKSLKKQSSPDKMAKLAPCFAACKSSRLLRKGSCDRSLGLFPLLVSSFSVRARFFFF